MSRVNFRWFAHIRHTLEKMGGSIFFFCILSLKLKVFGEQITGYRMCLLSENKKNILDIWKNIIQVSHINIRPPWHHRGSLWKMGGRWPPDFYPPKSPSGRGQNGDHIRTGTQQKKTKKNFFIFQKKKIYRNLQNNIINKCL